ncbi:MAG: hypothetical protein MSG78_10945 [Clostridiales bacterium]|nr:hypothetical protein [Clostridiales bacterium]
METKDLKNLDKQVVGCRCYNVANDKWCVIMEVYSDYCVVRDESDNVIHDESREHLYPIFEGMWTSANKDDVCYEINKDVDYPFYCPADDENYYGCELEHKPKPKENTENKMEEVKEAQYVNVRIDRKNASAILETIIKGLETEFLEEFLPVDKEMSTDFIFYAIYKLYNPEDESSLQKIFALYNNNTLYSLVCDLFDEHFLNVCQDTLITTELMKAIDQTTLESLLEEVNCLDYPVLDKIYHNDMETINEYRKKLGIDALIDKHLKKSYKVKAVIVRKFVIDVDAKNWQEAKKKALEDLDKPIPSDNCNFVESEPKIVNWN